MCWFRTRTVQYSTVLYSTAIRASHHAVVMGLQYEYPTSTWLGLYGTYLAWGYRRSPLRYCTVLYSYEYEYGSMGGHQQSSYCRGRVICIHPSAAVASVLSCPSFSRSITDWSIMPAISDDACVGPLWFYLLF